MPQQKSYAIRCSTEEQARECENNKLNYYYEWVYTRFLHNKYILPSITYEDAISLWLLWEKKEDLTKRWYAPWLYTYWKCSDCWCKLERVEKRAWRCKKCAGIEKQKELQSMDQVEPVKESPSEDIVEKILMEILVKTNPNGHVQDIIRTVLKKYLSSK